MTGPSVYSEAILQIHNELYGTKLFQSTKNTNITFSKNNIKYRIYGIDYNNYFIFKYKESSILYKNKKHWREEQREKNLIKN